MKKTIVYAASAVLMVIVSCSKEETTETISNGSPVFTASISGSTKTTVNVADGKVSWESADEITVTDASLNSSIYEIESIDPIDGKATFVLKDGQSVLGTGPYSATYGSEPATEQTYSASAGNLYMTAPSTSSNSFTFDVQCGLMKINLTKTGESVKSIAVTGTPAGGSESVYTLTCEPAESIESAKDFFIALPAGIYTKIEITNASDATCTLNAGSGVSVANNHIKPVTLPESKINFTSDIPAGALPGVFTVSAGADGIPGTADDVKVLFSRGNLYYDGSNWGFEANQNDFRTYVGKASCINGEMSETGTPANNWGLFGWSTPAYTYGMSVNTSSTYTGDFIDWGSAIDDKDTWRTLSSEEWTYMFNTRTVNGGTGTDKSYSISVTFGGVTGTVIYPDDYTGAAVSGIVSTLPDGVVFLPAAGQRNGTMIQYVTSGFYWSSSMKSSSYAYALKLDIENVTVTTGSLQYRYKGCSVRLVTAAN